MILLNNKRIDGVSLDTVPVGTISPFIGLVAPQGYLLCQGQKVSKNRYKQLYNMCKSLFGPETETEFYLPDLRGRVIAGLNENDATMDTIGKILGTYEHNHSTGNHTLTIDEIPSHNHRTMASSYAPLGGTSVFDYAVNGVTDAPNWSASIHNANTGGSQAHNHGDTGLASNYQPTTVMNYIVKAEMVIPNQSTVYNGLDSDSEVNSLSAAKGKELNEKFNNYSLLNTTPQTPESNTKISWLQLGYNDRWLLYLKGNTDGIDKDFYIELSETADKKDTGWLPVTFETNYSNYSNYEPCCYRVKGNQIFFKGLVNCGQPSAKCGDTICRFDTQYAPTKARYFTVCTSTAETGNAYEHSPAAITVQPSGIIRFHNVPVSGWISLEQITYLLD